MRHASTATERDAETALRDQFVAQVLRTLDERGMSQRELAMKLGMYPSQITALLHSSRSPTLSTVSRVALALEVDVDIRFS